MSCTCLYNDSVWLFDAAADLAAIQEQFPVEPLKYLPKTLRLPFEEGMRLLQEAGFEVTCFPCDCHRPSALICLTWGAIFLELQRSAPCALH